MATIFHLALASDWAAARETGAYTTSTRGQTLAEVGFIHASRGDQWPAVREQFYADVDEPLVLLRIDTDLLDVPVVEEAPEPGATVTFPHIYGPLPVAAVVQVIPLPPRGAAAQSAAATRPTASSPADFSRAYFAEMAFNVALLVLALVVGVVGAGVGRLTGVDGAVGIGGFIGLAVGLVVAAVLFRRRHART
jgi:uncharacterized protein (TIGR03382 family)